MTYPNHPTPVGAQKLWYDQLRAYILELESRVVALENRRTPSQVASTVEQVFTHPFNVVTTSTDYTLTQGEAGSVSYVTPSANVTLTLPDAFEGAWYGIVHAGSANVLSVSNGTNIIAQLDPGNHTTIYATMSSGSTSWASGAVTVASGGAIVSKQAVMVDNANAGLIWKDSNGDYWRVTIDTSGALVSTNIGSDRATSSDYETE